MSNEEMKEYCVIVNGGSGCIFQPSDPITSYILTAKHNIETNSIIQSFRFIFRNGQWQEIEVPVGTADLGRNYFPHPDKDIAILKIDRIPDLEKVIRRDRIDTNQNTFSLLGYPGTRRNNPKKNDWFRFDPNVSVLLQKDNGRFEAQIPESPTRNEVIGQSGGLIATQSGKYISVVGIQNSMTSAVNEQLGRIDFTGLESFDEIVASYPEMLSPILPTYMSKFNFLKSEAFNLDGGFDDNDIAYARGYLKNKTEEVINSQATPFAIKEYFQQRILIHSQVDDVLQSRALWLTWLEFLTILCVIQQRNYSQHELLEVFNSVRLLYSETDHDWSSEINNLVYSDYKGLKDNGIVIVGVAKPPINSKYVLEKGCNIHLITQAKKERDKTLLKIDAGIDFPFERYKFVHLDYFKGYSIVSKFKEYREINDDETLCKKLKEQYNELFR